MDNESTNQGVLANKPVFTEPIQLVLVEFSCKGCGELMYKQVAVMGSLPYPENLEKLPELLEMGEKELYHSGPVYENEKMKKENLPSGYSHCGPFYVLRLWKEWENPKRYGQEQQTQGAGTTDEQT